MRAIVLAAALVALVHGRPEAGYTYNKPGVSFTGGISGGVIPSGVGIINGGLPSNAVIPTHEFQHSSGGSSVGQISGISGSGAIGGGGGHSFTDVSGGSSFSSISGSSSSFNSGSFGGASFSGGQFGGSAIGSGISGGQLVGPTIGSGIGGGQFGGHAIGGSIDSGASFGGHGATLVQKHIYVHVPPPEPEDLHPQRPISYAPAQKHYKIIFIKAPAPPSPTAPIIPLQPQNEEKTLVYVLVKKPDDQPDIHIPTPAPTQPSKPEVYFIKYKTQKHTTTSGSNIGQEIIDHGAIDGSSVLASSVQSGSVSGSISDFGISQSTQSQSSVSQNYGPPGHQPGPY